jgi:serine/threonine-protein kinase
VLQAGEADGLAYIASAYCPGSTLAAWLKRQAGPVPPETAARLVLRLAEAVQYVHGRGIWHRDIKPANVLLDAPTPAECELPFTPRLTDFGLALLAERLEVTRSGVVGTPAYMAPEQAGGRVRETGAHTDVYGLGALLYEALTGRPPFEGGPDEDTARRMQEILRQVREEEPAPPSRLRPGVPRDLETVCLKCLEKAPKDRYATAGALADDLRRSLAGEPIQGRPPSALGRLRRAVRKRPLRSAAAALLLLVLAGGLGAGYYFDPERPRREVPWALRRGRAYEFEGHERLPGPFREVIGNTGALKPNPAENCFSIETLRISLWELVADPRCQHYRLTAEVRHDSASETSLVGLFLGYREHRTAAGERQAGFYTLAFADRGTRAQTYKDDNDEPVSRFQVRCGLSHVLAGEEVFPSGSVTRGFDFRPELPIARPGPWRRLGVEVTPEGIKTFWADADGALRPAEPVPAAKLERRHAETARGSPEAADVPTDYRPRSGVGLYVLSGAASFRRVTIQPLRSEGEPSR